MGDQGRISAATAVLLAGLTAAMVGGFMHDPSPPVGRFEESLVWQWVSIGGAEIALLGAGMRIRLSPVVGAGKGLLAGGLVSAWYAALVFDPNPVLSWDNVIPLLVFTPASVYAVLHTLATNYII